jgi:hypothetical protein
VLDFHIYYLFVARIYINPLQVCDWPATAGCQNGSGTFPNGCPADFDVHQLLPHADCTKFYYCVFGEKVERDCPPELHFNPTLQVRIITSLMSPLLERST